MLCGAKNRKGAFVVKWFFDVNYHRHDKSRRRGKRLFRFGFVLLILVGAYVAWDILRVSSQPDGPSAPTAVKESVYTIPSKTYTTKYFEMKTPESWEFQEKLSNDNKFVYYNIKHKLARGMLTIYVDQPPVPAHKQATRILPVKLGPEGMLVPDNSVTPHCSKKAPGRDKVGEEIVKQNGIMFTCDNDATWFSVSVALEGGSPNMRLRRPDGTHATYVIYYRDSTATPSANDMIEVIRKFKVL